MPSVNSVRLSARRQLAGELLVGIIGIHAQRHAGLLFADRAARSRLASRKIRGHVAGVDDRELVLPAIDQPQHQRHEAVFPAAAGKALVELADGRGRAPLAGQAVAGIGRELGHQQGGGNALAGDVGHDHRQPVVGQLDVVEVVAADLVGRLVEVEEVIVGQIFGGLAGQAALAARGGPAPGRARTTSA